MKTLSPLDQVLAELADLNKKVGSIIAILQKPENKIAKVLSIAGSVVEILALFTIIDIIRSWIVGG